MEYSRVGGHQDVADRLSKGEYAEAVEIYETLMARDNSQILSRKNMLNIAGVSFLDPSKKARVQRYMPASEEQFKSLGAEIMGRNPEGHSQKVFLERFKSFFGVDPVVCEVAW